MSELTSSAEWVKTSLKMAEENAALRTRLEASEQAAYDVAGTIDALKQRLAQVEQGHCLKCNMGPQACGHPGRKLALKLNSTLLDLATAQQERDNLRLRIQAVDAEHEDMVRQKQVSIDAFLKLEQERDDWQSRHAALMQQMAMAQARIGELEKIVSIPVSDECAELRGRVRALEEALERCLEDLRQWAKTYPRAARDSRDELLDNLSTNDVIIRGEQALTPAKEQGT